MRIKKAVIPVAGKGTRFLPATKQLPKEMIPILGRPMIHYVVDEVVRSGIEQIIFVTASGKWSIEDYFDSNKELENFLEEKGKFEELKMCQNISDMIEVVSVRQKKPLGLGHAILCAQHVVGDDNFAVLLGDDIIIGEKAATKQLMDVSTRNSGVPVIGVMEVDREDTSKYGIVDGKFIDENKKTLKMEKMIEKPKPELAPTNLATPGRYILPSSIFDYLKKIKPGAGGEYQLTDAINLMCQDTDVFAHLFVGERFDTGSVEGHLNAIVDFAIKDPQYSETMKNIIKDMNKKYKII